MHTHTYRHVSGSLALAALCRSRICTKKICGETVRIDPRSSAAAAAPAVSGQRRGEEHVVVEGEASEGDGIACGLDARDSILKEQDPRDDDERVASDGKELEHHDARTLDDEEGGNCG